MIFENCIAVLEKTWKQHGSQNSICKHWFKRLRGFSSGASGKEPACQCRGHKRYVFNPWVEKIPWRRDGLLTLVFLPGESHGQGSLAGYSP